MFFEESILSFGRMTKKVRAGLASSNNANDCEWSGYLNNFDRPVDYICPDGQIITGFQSYYDSWKEDRRWSVRCCNVSTNNLDLLTFGTNREKLF